LDVCCSWLGCWWLAVASGWVVGCAIGFGARFLYTGKDFEMFWNTLLVELSTAELVYTVKLACLDDVSCGIRAAGRIC